MAPLVHRVEAWMMLPKVCWHCALVMTWSHTYDRNWFVLMPVAGRKINDELVCLKIAFLLH